MDGVRAATRLAVPPSLEMAGTVRRRLRDDLHRSRTPGPLAADAEIVLGEMLGNALLHGTPRNDGTIGVEWVIGDTSVRVAVSDGGAPPRLRAYDPPTFAATGRGLRIVTELARE